MNGFTTGPLSTGRFVRFTYLREGEKVAVVTSGISASRAFLTGPVLPEEGEIVDLHLSLGEEEEVFVRGRVTRVVTEATGEFTSTGIELYWIDARTTGKPVDIKEFLRLLPGDPEGRLVAEATADGRVEFRYVFPDIDPPDVPTLSADDLAGVQAIAMPAAEEIEEDTDPEISAGFVAEDAGLEDGKDEDDDDEDTPVDDIPVIEELEEDLHPSQEVELLADFGAMAEATDPDAESSPDGDEPELAAVDDYLLEELLALEREAEQKEEQEEAPDNSVAEPEPETAQSAEPEPPPTLPDEAVPPPLPEPEPESELESEPDVLADLPIEIEDPSGLLPLEEHLTQPEAQPESPPSPAPSPVSNPKPSRTQIHEPEESIPAARVGSSLATVDIPARIVWGSRSLRGKAVQLARDQVRVEASGVLPELFTRVRVLLAPSGRKMGELSLWANVTRVRTDAESAGTHGVMTLSLAVQNARADIRKYREMVRRARG